MNYPGTGTLKEVVPGATSLIEHIDKRIFIRLIDGQLYCGILGGADRFLNVVLHDAVKRASIHSVVPGADDYLLELMTDFTNKSVFIWLRDKRMFVGTLGYFDIDGDLVLQDAVERVQRGNFYVDVPRGRLDITGEDLALLGEI